MILSTLFKTGTDHDVPMHTSRHYRVTSEDQAYAVAFALMAVGRYAAVSSTLAGWTVETRPGDAEVDTTEFIVRGIDPAATLATQRIGA